VIRAILAEFRCPECHPDPLVTARGCVLGLALGALLWVAVTLAALR